MADTVADPAQAALVNKLKQVCAEAYLHWPNSCSHAVWFVLQKMIDPSTQWLEANALIQSFADKSTIWKTVSVDDGWALAQKGIVVIGGRKHIPNGHVLVIYPGDKKNSGGYLAPQVDPKTKTNVMKMLRSHGVFPRALSTSIGKTWPGAMSNGDKTVWDPFGTDLHFAEVVFYTRTT
jgi:hypothetical protein